MRLKQFGYSLRRVEISRRRKNIRVELTQKAQSSAAATAKASQFLRCHGGSAPYVPEIYAEHAETNTRNNALYSYYFDEHFVTT